MASPFIYDGPVSRTDMIDRETELDQLIDAARAGRLVCVTGPRRYGKTTLLDAAVEVLSEAHGMVAVRIDLYGVLSLTDFAVRLEHGYREALQGPVRRRVQSLLVAADLGVSLSGGGFKVTVSRKPRTDPLAALHTLLDLPTKISERVYVVLDEFQSLMDVHSGEAILRSHIQRHAKHASYAFAGSEPGLVQKAFSDRRRPLYAQARQLRLGRLPGDALLEAFHAGFDATGRRLGDTGEAILRLADRHPQRTMLLADRLWERVPRRKAATEEALMDAYEEVLAETRAESQARWEALTANQRRVLRGVVEYGSPVTNDALAALALPRGSVVKTARALIDDGDLEQDDGGRYELVDPFFAAWIRRHVTTTSASVP